MPEPTTTPQQLLERLIAQLEDIQRGNDHTIENQNALRHARACEEWLSLHESRMAKRAASDASLRVSGASE